MTDIAAMAERIVRKAKEYDRDTIPGDYATLGAPCPNCGGVVKENYRRFTCIGADGASLSPVGGSESAGGCGFSITKIPAGRSFELLEVEAFLCEHKIGPLEGFRSKAGWPFSAELKLVRDDEIKNWKLEFDFGDDAKGADGEAVEIDFSGQPSMGVCPKCKAHVYEHGANYACQHAVSAPVTCDFKTGKIILTQPISHEQVTKLLAIGKTDLLDGFVSNRTKRKFKAMLVWDEKEGKVGFEFAPRAAAADGKVAAPPARSYAAAAKKVAAKKVTARKKSAAR
jgi:DNA topoisomerase-3